MEYVNKLSFVLGTIFSVFMLYMLIEAYYHAEAHDLQNQAEEATAVKVLNKEPIKLETECDPGIAQRTYNTAYSFYTAIKNKTYSVFNYFSEAMQSKCETVK